MKKLVLLTTLFGLFLSGCVDADCCFSVISSDPTEVILAGEGGQESLFVTSTMGWKVLKSPPWVTVDPTKENGSTEVTLSADENFSADPRSGEVILIADNGDRVEVAVSQPPTPYIIKITPLSIILPGDGGADAVSITCPISWSVISKPTWVTVTPTNGSGTMGVTLSADENFSANPLDGEVVFQAQNGATVAVSVSQSSASQLIRSTRSSITLPGEGGNDVVSITCPIGWSVTSKPAWVTVSPSSGSGSTNVTISAGEKLSAGTQSGNVVFTADNGDTVVITVSQPQTTNLISANKSSVTLPGAGGNDVVTITCPIGWSVVAGYPAWIGVSPTTGGNGATNVTLSAVNNSSGSARNGNVVFQAPNGLQVTVAVSQPLPPPPPNLKVTFTDGSTEDIYVSSFTAVEFTLNYPTKTIRYIQALSPVVLNGGVNVLIGRKANETIKLSFNGSGTRALQHRAAVGGFIPIGSYAEFQLINSSASTLNKNYKQEGYLDFMNEEWTPIGNNTTPFIGQYDGNDYLINNLKIDRSADWYIALFGCVGDDSNNGFINRVHVGSGNVKGNTYVGGICGYLGSGSVTYCSNAAAVTGYRSRAGGVCGIVMSASVSHCSNSGTIVGVDAVGGVIGCIWRADAEVTFCSNSGRVEGTGFTGGVVGDVMDGALHTSYNLGTVVGTGSTGGVVGYHNGGAFLYASYNAGGVNGSGGQYSGGVVGNGTGTIIACYNTGNCLGNATNSGGIAAIAHPARPFIACYNTGTGWTYGLVGGNTVSPGVYCYASYWQSSTTGMYTPIENGVDIVQFTMPYTFTPNTTLYPDWTVNPTGSGPAGYWKNYSSGGLPKLWWE